MTVRKHVFFSGMVQGVGFRYQACRIAASLHLTGWVKNLYDGRVEMEAQGEEKDVDSLIDQLNKQPYIRIKKIVKEDIPLLEGEEKFHW